MQTRWITWEQNHLTTQRPQQLRSVSSSQHLCTHLTRTLTRQSSDCGTQERKTDSQETHRFGRCLIPRSTEKLITELRLCCSLISQRDALFQEQRIEINPARQLNEQVEHPTACSMVTISCRPHQETPSSSLIIALFLSKQLRETDRRFQHL